MLDYFTAKAVVQLAFISQKGIFLNPLIARFGIPLDVTETSSCGIKPRTSLVALILKAKLIIWDEAPMLHRHCFESIDRGFRNVMKMVDKRNKDIPFGGKVVVFGGFWWRFQTDFSSNS